MREGSFPGLAQEGGGQKKRYVGGKDKVSSIYWAYYVLGPLHTLLSRLNLIIPFWRI